MIVQWNTGALYTKYGQRIIAEVLPDGSIRFLDRDRGIAGEISAPDNPAAVPRTAYDVERRVMFRYNHNDYKSAWDTKWAQPHLEPDV